MKIGAVLDFATGGRATLFIKGKDDTYEFRITRKEHLNKNLVWFVYGRANHDEFKYLCAFAEDYKLKITKASSEGKPLAAFYYVWGLALDNKETSLVSVWHDGRCSRCHRKLTDEKSVELGIGPDCREALNIQI